MKDAKRHAARVEASVQNILQHIERVLCGANRGRIRITRHTEVPLYSRRPQVALLDTRELPAHKPRKRYQHHGVDRLRHLEPLSPCESPVNSLDVALPQIFQLRQLWYATRPKVYRFRFTQGVVHEQDVSKPNGDTP